MKKNKLSSRLTEAIKQAAYLPGIDTSKIVEEYERLASKLIDIIKSIK